jgi:hydrogenase maturation protease
MNCESVRCLILACGNTLRSDDGVGPWLAAWAEDRFREQSGVLTLYRQQWTPDLAKEIASAETVLFIDCSLASAAGELALADVHPSATCRGLATHHLGAAELLALAHNLYGSLPSQASLLTVGAGSTALGEQFSPEVIAALPQACTLVEAFTARAYKSA